MNRHTIQIRPLFFEIGSGKKTERAMGYEVEFYRRGEHVETRSYGWMDMHLMSARIEEWMKLNW